MHRTIIPAVLAAAMLVPGTAVAQDQAGEANWFVPYDTFRARMVAVRENLDGVMTFHEGSDVALLVGNQAAELLMTMSPDGCYAAVYMAWWALVTDLRRATVHDADQLMADRDVLEDAEANTFCFYPWQSPPPVDGVPTEPPHTLPPETVPTPGVNGSASGDLYVSLRLTDRLTITDPEGTPMPDIGVRPGDTVHFQIDNSADFEHSFYIGAAEDLRWGDTTRLQGVAAWAKGIRRFAYVVPEEGVDLQFGCIIPGHYDTMHGTITIIHD